MGATPGERAKDAPRRSARLWKVPGGGALGAGQNRGGYGGCGGLVLERKSIWVVPKGEPPQKAEPIGSRLFFNCAKVGSPVGSTVFNPRHEGESQKEFVFNLTDCESLVSLSLP